MAKNKLLLWLFINIFIIVIAIAIITVVVIAIITNKQPLIIKMKVMCDKIGCEYVDIICFEVLPKYNIN